MYMYSIFHKMSNRAIQVLVGGQDHEHGYHWGNLKKGLGPGPHFELGLSFLALGDHFRVV